MERTQRDRGKKKQERRDRNGAFKGQVERERGKEEGGKGGGPEDGSVKRDGHVGGAGTKAALVPTEL